MLSMALTLLSMSLISEVLYVDLVLWLLPDSPVAPPEDVEEPESPLPVEVSRPDLTVLSISNSSPNVQTSKVRVSK